MTTFKIFSGEREHKDFNFISFSFLIWMQFTLIQFLDSSATLNKLNELE